MAVTIVVLLLIGTWHVVLQMLVERARNAVGSKAAGFNAATYIAFIPIVSFAAIFFPAVFLGRELVGRLRSDGVNQRRIRFVRVGSLSYLVALPIAVLLPSIVTGDFANSRCGQTTKVDGTVAELLSDGYVLDEASGGTLRVNIAKDVSDGYTPLRVGQRIEATVYIPPCPSGVPSAIETSRTAP